ncbi:MAG: hypothetical protein LBM99_02840 [Bacillales bacterium]|jgi:N utilization substance protein B|nr:hypothetical protein [Bacillales bacterium]
MSDNSLKFTRNHQHELIFLALFEYLFYKDAETIMEPPSLNQIIEDATETKKEVLPPFVVDVVFSADEHYLQAVKDLQVWLIEWAFERLGIVERSVLLLAYIERYFFNTPKIVLINVCIKLTIKYTTEERASSFINGILENVLQ